MLFRPYFKGKNFGVLAFCGTLFLAYVLPLSVAVGQETRVIEEEHQYLNPKTLSDWQIADGNIRIYLWGIEPIDLDDPIFKLKARSALSEKIGGGKISCVLKSEKVEFVLAQCVNDKNEDLSLYMIQQGYVTALRSAVYGTLFEKPYLSAEEEAQRLGLGIWASENGARNTSGESGFSKEFFLIAVLFFIVGVMGLGYISFHIMKGFRRVVDVQNKSIDLAIRERHIKDKERFVIAAMLDSEVRENKNKIDAYLIVYEEVLNDLMDSSRTPKYKKSGDIIQRQPSLGRSVFDGNTDRLDLMGQYLASDLIHYYARIKTVPDFVEVSPDTPIEDVLKLVRSAIDQAQKLNHLSVDLTQKFVSSGIVKRDIS